MKYDAIVIGSGQAGTPLSFRLADIGWQVVLVEKSYLGGTCINTGCTPTKTMIHRAQVAHYARNAARWGVRASEVSADLPEIAAQKDKVVHSFRDGREKQMKRRPNLHFYSGQARFVDDHKIRVDETLLESDKIFIDTGGRARVSGIPGLDAIPYLTNENIMDLTVLPEHLIVLGGGYIGLEFGQMFTRFGSRVTVIHHKGQILPREDPEISGELQRVLEEEGLKFLLNARTTLVKKDGGTIVVSVDRANGRSNVSGSHLLVAIGRQPNTNDLGLEKTGIETDSSGFIKVNSRLETNVPGIWALGDVKGGPAFTHIS
jgi:pyruvate/2-oxoglutarate dehydrogenase complex dihydrolipoamide dehydrogenase (E3) component